MEDNMAWNRRKPYRPHNPVQRLQLFARRVIMIGSTIVTFIGLGWLFCEWMGWS
jgi:hypothetical protein